MLRWAAATLLFILQVGHFHVDLPRQFQNPLMCQLGRGGRGVDRPPRTLFPSHSTSVSDFCEKGIYPIYPIYPLSSFFQKKERNYSNIPKIWTKNEKRGG